MMNYLQKRLAPLAAIVMIMAASTGSAQTLFQPPGACRQGHDDRG
jgi:hypothetical protein